MVAERSRAAVALAVHVGGHHPSQGDEMGPGGDRGEPSAWQKDAVEPPQRHSGLAAYDARFSIEGEQAVRQCGVGDRAVLRWRQRGVAVRATETAREDDVGRDRFQILAKHFVGLGDGIVAPSGQSHRRPRAARLWRNGRRAGGGIGIGEGQGRLQHRSL